MPQKNLSPLEQEVMNVVWDAKPCSVRDVQNKLQNKKLAYTTVATILQRLVDKELVVKKQETGSLKFVPKVSKTVYSKNIARDFLKQFLNSFGDSAIASFAESIESLPKQKREYFIKLLERHDKDK